MSQPVSANLKSRLEWSLLSLRLGIFIVFFMWTLDKFINPAHSAQVLKAFYGISGSTDTLFYILGVLQLLLVVAFVAGIKKRLTYGVILLMHAASTLASYPRYIDGFSNLLFFAAWPMLAACIALYLLRDADVKFTVK